MIKIRYTALSLLLCLGLSACGGSNIQEELGLKKRAPDEFAVVKRAPLEMPPDYGLRPPTPGAPRPQEQSTSEQARQTVFGEESRARSDASDAESIFLEEAGANSAAPNIRETVDDESAKIIDENRPVADKLLGLVGKGEEEPSASVVDAKEEAARIKKNMEEGKPVTEGETPTVED